MNPPAEAPGLLEPRIHDARLLHHRGDLAAAIAAYEALLAESPERSDLWHLKGIAEHQAGRLDAALESATRAIATGGSQPAFLLLEAGVRHDRGELEAAEAGFVRLIRARPGWPVAQLELGRVLMDRGRVAAALEAFRAAVDVEPGYVRAWNNIGVALRLLDRHDEALRAFNHVLALDSRYALAHFNIALIHQARNEIKRALESAMLAVRLDPSLVDAHLLIGDIERRQRHSAEALAAYRAAVAAEPRNVKARVAHAELLAEIGHYAQAREEFTRAAASAPGNLRAAFGANLLLPLVYESASHLAASRAGYVAGLERLHEHADRFRFAQPQTALAEARWTNFYLAYQGSEDREPQKRFGEFQKRVLEPAVPEMFEPRARAAQRDRIRVGFLSHFFFNCTAGRYFSSWITHLDKQRFEPYVYYTNEWVADDTRTIAAAANVFRHLPGRPAYAVAQQVAADELDVLVYPELGMHPETFVLGNLRLAPVQCAGWGHPVTPGLGGIDWFISCAEMEPGNAASHYNEKLATLPGLGTRYAIPPVGAPATRADFALPEEKTLYLVPQSLFKIHPDNDEVIARVLAADPRGMAVMFASHHDILTQAFAARLSVAFRKHGLDLEDRVLFLMPFMPHGDYLRLNTLCDVMIDTLHWSGGNTSLDALASGLPVVTHPGAFMRGRQSQAMLKALGVPELVVPSTDALVETVVRLGKSADERRSILERIAAGRGNLFEREEPVRALEEFLERAVRDSRGA